MTTTQEEGLFVVPEKQYHVSAGVSKSALSHMSRSPYHYKYRLDNPIEQTDAMAMGSLVHCMNLEPQRMEAEYAVAPKVDKRTKAGKETYAQFVESAAGKTVVSQSDMDTAQAMTDSLANHKLANEMLTEDGKTEMSCYSIHRETGLLRRGRFDKLVEGKGIYDLKTTSDASPDAFMKSVVNFGYHVQASYYMDMAEQQLIDVPNFYFICVENKAPYGCAVYTLDETALKAGYDQYTRNLKKLKMCVENDFYPCYSSDVTKLASPSWI